MPIDTWEPFYSSGRARATTLAGGGNIYAIVTATFLDTLRSTLLSCGWTENPALYASGTISYPLGAPFVSGTQGVTAPISCSRGAWLKFAGVNFIPYNPLNESPGVGCDPSNVYFAWGLTGNGTLDNLAAAISNSTHYTAGRNSGGIGVIANLPGPTYNFPQCLTDGSWGIPSQIEGGGYSITSAAGTTPVTVQVNAVNGTQGTSGPTDGELKWFFTSAGIGGSATIFTQLHAVSGGTFKSVTILASAHGFTVYNPDTDSLLNTPISILFSSVNIPDGFVSVPAFFIVGPGAFRHTMFAWNVAYTCLNGGINAIDGSGPYPRPIFARTPGVSLNTLAGAPLLQGAYVGFGGYEADQFWAVGRMPDCIITSQYMQPNGGGLIIQGQKFEVVSSQDGSSFYTPCSLLWRYE